MSDTISRRYADWITSHSKLVVVAVLALTVLVAAGAAVGETDSAGVGEFQVDTEETDAAEFVRENYGGSEGIAAQLVVRDEGGDVLTRDSLLAGLRLQQAIRDDDSISETLAEPGLVGIENVVGTAAVYADATEGGGPPPAEPPSLSAQITALEDRSDAQVEQLLARVLDPEGSSLTERDPYAFLSRDYEPGETRAEARLTFVTQVGDGSADEDPQAAYDAQVEIAGMVEERFADAFVFGQGIQDDASTRATGDSFTIITPFALALIILVLGITYRDVLDILLAFVGIGVVMAWLAGLMGWLAIPMNVILIAVPFLLIGLSIDYALHVVMRYREARAGTLEESTASGGVDDRSIRTAMALGFGSVVLALGAATVSTGVGFLSNVVSPLPAIRDFAVLSAGGIFATFVAFGVFLPALKIEVDSFVEHRLGRSRAKPAFGVGGGSANAILERLGSLTMRAPVVIVVVALLLGTVGAYGATTIDTEFNEADFLPTDAPDWAKSLPGPLAPDTYTIADDFQYLSDNFQLRGEGGQSQVLLRGDGLAEGSLLSALDDATGSVSEDSSIQLRPDGRAALDGPHTAIRSAASDNETFAALVERSDTNGDGLPDEDVEAVYTALFDADEAAASQVLSRSADGEITSARIVLSVRSSESAQTIADDTRTFAEGIEAETTGITAAATGSPVSTAVIQDALLETLVEAFAVTLVVILVFATGLFGLRYGSWSLGALVLAPVVVSLAWLLGAMAALDISFNSETAVITSLAIGLGVDYSIHAGERFMAEREERDTVADALRRTITGTGGTLLASAATTAAAFGVLAFSLSPPLQRFGIVTGLAIIFAFVAVVTMLPGLLVLRERAVSGGLRSD
ncbi:exporter of the RND superfamily protein-like protein [Halorhabdus tiamatea SARL4B]|uniref:MMPL-type membrane transport protein, putative lipid transporter n=1 Tax=Halorhabdus tiamatea SARL4B TaxID=1033806 RepID=F7PF22_9EURY|nr:MMPL family transporter [Halorhabdus tiamatea]ERJ06010.1 exporter of the RND superfamily protein-like protein [Halorhabdus tiamatea SARL4B]CCQ34428.1 MMPL-type membrane transport protein, putative lipid transporter [Halorhabdus tiamatea SARL4B]